MAKVTLLYFLFLTSLRLFGQDITGQWNGVLKLQGTQFTVVFNIKKTNDGYSSTMDSPNQGVTGISVTSTKFESSVLNLEVSSADIEYNGILNNEDSVVGNFKQHGLSFPMNLIKVKTKENTIAEENPDTAYKESPIALQTKKGQVFGTLTTPKNFSNAPIVLIIAGSGPTDRDCNSPIIKCDAYKKLAHELAENNIASVRYDKRGVAESRQSDENEADIRFDDYINDAKGWIHFLRQDKRFSKIIVIGHSEGSLIGMIAATDADKFISIAGAGQSANKVLKIQLSNPEKDIQDSLFAILDSLANGKTVDNVDPAFNSFFRPSVQPYLISWFKYDPQVEIQKLVIPVLIIQGTNDIQVSVDDAKRLSKANPKSQLILIEKMNHILRTVDGGRQENIATYNNPSLPLAGELLKDICSFIFKN